LRRATNENTFVHEVTLGVELGVGLRYNVFLFFIGGEIHDLGGDVTVFHDTVRRFDETEVVDSGIACQRTNETNVGALRGFDGAHAAVVREVNISNFEASTFAGQTTRSERRKATTVSKARQRVDLVHEL